jgi:hypothetical protein
VTLFAAVRRWLDERFDLDDLTAPLRHKTVPTIASPTGISSEASPFFSS